MLPLRMLLLLPLALALGLMPTWRSGVAQESVVLPPTISLEGEVWQIDTYLTAIGMREASNDEGNRYAVFENGRFRVNAGCGTVSGSYWLEGRRMLFSPHVESMVGDCPETLQTQEQAIVALLRVVERVGVDDAGVALLDADGTALVTLTPPDAVPLQGRLWQLTTYRNADGVIVPAQRTPAFTLMFENAVNLSGQACDVYRASYSRDDRFLRLAGPVAVSRRLCADVSDAAAAQASAYIAVLGQVDSYRVDAESLLLRDETGRMIARFAAVPGGATPQPLAERDDQLPPAPVPLLP